MIHRISYAGNQLKYQIFYAFLFVFGAILAYIDTSDELRGEKSHKCKSFESPYNKLKQMSEMLALRLSLFKTNII